MEMRRRALLEKPGSNGRTAAQGEIDHELAALVLENGVVSGVGKRSRGVSRRARASVPSAQRLGDRVRARH